MQIAKMFASLGFNIEMGDLTRFEVLLSATKTHMKEFALSTQVAHKSVTSLSRKMITLNGALEGSTVAAATTKYQKAFNNYSANVARMQDVLETFIPIADATLTTINRVTRGVDAGSVAWVNYATSTREAGAALLALKSSMVGVTAARVAAGSGSFGRAGKAGGGGGGGGGGAGAAAEGSMLGSFAKPFMPSVMGMGMTALAAGYATKLVIQAGQKVQALHSMMLSVSHDAEDSEKNMEYTFSLAQKFGLDWLELGESFSRMLSAAEHTLGAEKTKTMLEGITAEMTVLHMSVADQKGVFLGLNHAMERGVIHANNYNQIVTRMPAAARLFKVAAKNMGVPVTNMQEALRNGLLESAKIFPELARLMQLEAEKNNALALAMHTSRAAVTRMHNVYMKFAGDMAKAGSDEAAGAFVDVLTKLVKKLSESVLWLFKGIKGIAAFAKAHELIAKAVGIVTVAYFLLRMEVIRTGIAAVAQFILMGVFAGVAGGAVGVLTFAFKALKGAIIATGLGLLLVGLVEAGTAYNDYLNGADNWVNNLVGKLEILKASFQLAGFQAELLFKILKSGGGTSAERTAFLTAPDTEFKKKESLWDQVSNSNYLALISPAAAVGKWASSMFNSPLPSNASPASNTTPTRVEPVRFEVSARVNGRDYVGTQDANGHVISLTEIPAQ